MHTPTPWIVKERDNELFIYSKKKKESIAILLGDDNDEMVGPVGGMKDAEFIVKAVNSYQVMRDALELVQRTKDWAIATNRRAIADCCDWSVIDKALALAEGDYHDSTK